MTRQKRTWLASGIVAGALILGSAGAALAANTGVGSGMMGGSTHIAVAGGMMGNGSGSMMGGHGSGGMMGNGSGATMGSCDPSAMMGGAGQMMGSLYQPSPQAPVRSLAQAQQRVEQYLQRLGNKALKVDEVMQFEQNYYASVKDTSVSPVWFKGLFGFQPNVYASATGTGTGNGAFEVLVNKDTGAVYLEHGPAMMWNTRYGMADRMMGYQQPSTPMTIGAAQARQIAQQWLDQHQPGSTTETPDQFPGYYTVHILKGGKVTGMLSVNGYSGQVWYHTWHGAFVQMKDLHA